MRKKSFSFLFQKFYPSILERLLGERLGNWEICFGFSKLFTRYGQLSSSFLQKRQLEGKSGQKSPNK